ncbi:MAG: DUF1549 and DUF1553 domain-containing protein [Planctomycetes bacterium]|nr:DUF1549 and DUF1553 domain-containing protein [Planctomycetota bacterium]
MLTRRQLHWRRLALAVVFAALWPYAIARGEGASHAPPVDFIRDVTPVLVKAGCAGGACHGSFQGRGGFQLSLFGSDPRFDYAALVKEGRQRRVSIAAPEQSLILQKPSGRLPHGGGRRFTADSPAYRTLEAWIRSGAPAPADFELHVAGIEVAPQDAVLAAGESAPLCVTARWSDGRAQDVTSLAIYEVRDESRADVSPDGHVEAKRPGRTAVTVSFPGQSAAVSVTTPYGPVAETRHFTPHNEIDELLAAEWSKLGLAPAEPADDYEFVRRVFLDVIGTLPTREEVEAFSASNDPEKRAQLIDALLERPEYVDFWSYRWADLLRVHRRYVGDKGLWTFWNWVRAAVRENRPLDQFARELLTARGSLFTNGATAYYFVDEDPAQLAETTAQLFLGVRLACAKCHHHPYEAWSQQDYYGLASFFTRIEIKDNGDGARYGGTKLLRPIDRVNKTRRLKIEAPPSLFGREVKADAGGDIRSELADWVTSSDNPYFSRSLVNRYWAWLMGRGLVEPVDDLRPTNPPSMPPLLEALNADFVQHGYDAKHLVRTILNSRAYQLASRVTSETDRDGTFCTHRRYRRLPAPVLLDAVNFATGATESFEGLPRGTRALALPDPAVQSHFLTTFGRSVRSSPCECATSNESDLAQALHLLNGQAMGARISAKDGRLARLLASEESDAEIVDELFFATWSRPPIDTEREAAMAVIAEAPSRQEGFEDLLWTLLNSTAFVFNH